MRAFIGAATTGGQGSPAAGVSVVDVDGPEISLVGTALPGVTNPMYLALAPSGDVLYTVHETSPGQVSAWRVDGDSLRTLGPVRSAGGDGPCHLSIHPSGRFVLVAAYGSGTVAVLPVQDDGSLDQPSHVVQHVGDGPDTGRQSGPHAHMIVTGPGSGDVLAADLGTDEVCRYRLDETTGRLDATDPLVLPAGSGPRHLVIGGRWAYVAGELDSTVSAVDLDAGRVVATTSTRPTGQMTPSHPSAIRLAADGRFVYVANRGPDVIAVLSVDGPTLELVGTVPCGGAHPRDMVIAPDGRYLHVANQFGDVITSFGLDPRSGLPEPAGTPFGTASPACLVFA